VRLVAGDMLERARARASTPSSALEARSVTKAFGKMKAVADVSLCLPERGVSGLIGANGAGKTTLLNVLSGIARPDRGSVVFRGRDVTRTSASARARLGLARTFQHPRLVANLSCLENVMLGARSAGLRERELAARAAEALVATGLEEPRWLARPSAIPPPEHRWVELARAIVARPSILLLDEPNSGFTGDETARLVRLLVYVRDELHIPVALVTHDVSLAMGLCDQIAVLHQGSLIAAGTPAEIVASPDVVSAYLGEKGRAVALATLERAG
jgi:branched-chain amino acid transport system ATP-binding protein